LLPIDAEEMFEDSDLLRRDVLVLRATAPPDAQFSVLDETGREIGRVVAQGGLVQKEPARLVLHDRQHTPLLVVERFEGHDGTEARYMDGRGQPLGERLFTLKQQGRFLRRSATGLGWAIRDSRKAEVGSFAMALPPEGDYRLGVTHLFTITAEVTPEVRLAALGWIINLADKESRKPAWMLRTVPKLGLAWPGSASEALTG
jgi:hypothetical protein